MESKHSILEKHFGYTSFLPHQEEIIDAVLAQRDVLAVMATGAANPSATSSRRSSSGGSRSSSHRSSPL